MFNVLMIILKNRLDFHLSRQYAMKIHLLNVSSNQQKNIESYLIFLD